MSKQQMMSASLIDALHSSDFLAFFNISTDSTLSTLSPGITTNQCAKMKYDSILNETT